MIPLSNCMDVYRAGMKTPGSYLLDARGEESLGDPVRVHCRDGWTQILRRGQFPGHQVDFNRSWDEYEEGLGDPDFEYWIGLRHLFE